MKNSKNKKTNFLLIILLAILILAYKVIIIDPNADTVIPSEFSQSEVVIKVLNDLDSINLDTSVVKDPKFNTLKTMEIPLPNLPIGKKDPFSKANN